MDSKYDSTGDYINELTRHADQRTHCKWGHPWVTSDSWYEHPKFNRMGEHVGIRRSCRQCIKLKNAKTYRRQQIAKLMATKVNK